MQPPAGYVTFLFITAVAGESLGEKKEDTHAKTFARPEWMSAESPPSGVVGGGVSTRPGSPLGCWEGLQRRLQRGRGFFSRRNKTFSHWFPPPKLDN